MNVIVILKLSNKLRKRDKMSGFNLLSILSLFVNNFNACILNKHEC